MRLFLPVFSAYQGREGADASSVRQIQRPQASNSRSGRLASGASTTGEDGSKNSDRVRRAVRNKLAITDLDIYLKRQMVGSGIRIY